MAVVLLTTAATYEGTAGDPKPQAADGVSAGSTFRELDTGVVWIWSGTAWTTGPTAADPKHVDDLAASAALLDELVKIRRLLEEANGLDATDLIS